MASARRGSLDSFDATIVDDYEAVLAYFQRRRTPSGGPRPAREFGSIRGLNTLYRSMAAGAVSSQTRLEWNPLAQRPVVYQVPRLAPTVLGRELILLELASTHFVNLAHEMLHVALWEPLFVGALPSVTQPRFAALSLMAEASCFFFGDIIVSQAIRTTFPDGELVFARKAVGVSGFHPVRAFHALGVRDPQQMHAIYLAAFSGQRTVLSDGDSQTARALALRIAKFYQDAVGYMRRGYEALARTGFFGAFARRFFEMAKLPSLFPDEVLALARHPFAQAYFAAALGPGLRAAARLDEAGLRRIRVRRALQTRAYHAAQLEHVLAHRLFVGKRVSAATLSGLRRTTAGYLDRVEAMLAGLCTGTSAAALEADLRAADAGFDRGVHRVVDERALWVSRRDLIVPRAIAPSIEADLEAVSRLSADQLIAASLHTGARLAERVSPSLATADRRALSGRLAALMSAAAQAASDLPRARRTLAEALRSPEVLSVWSQPLASFRPSRNEFRELLFHYE